MNFSKECWIYRNILLLLAEYEYGFLKFCYSTSKNSFARHDTNDVARGEVRLVLGLDGGGGGESLGEGEGEEGFATGSRIPQASGWGRRGVFEDRQVVMS